MNVAELIEILKKQPQDLLVGYAEFNEAFGYQHYLLEADQVLVKELGVPKDGVVCLKRPREPVQTYLMLPGS